MKILALQADYAGCGNARIEVPYRALRSIGHDVEIKDRVSPENVSEYDVIVLQRPGNKWSLPIAEWCAERKTPLVIELDDLCWALPDWNPFKEAWEGAVEDGDGIKKSWEVQQDTLRLAQACTVTTEYLAEHIRPFCSNVYVLPNFLDLGIFSEVNHDRSPVTIGYFGSHTHQRDVEQIAGIIGKVLKRHPDAFLLTIGGYPPTDAALSHGVPKNQFRSLPWYDNREMLNTALSMIDIGLAPLEPHTFNRAKSWIKILEYGAVGVPTVASDFGPYHDFIQPSFGRLCKTKGEWRDVLNDLLEDKEKRLAMGRRAREVAEANSIQNNVWRYEAALKDVIEKFASQACLPVRERQEKGISHAYIS